MLGVNITESIAEQLNQKSGRILLVDDQPLNIQLVHRIFSDDHEVFMATSGKTALEFCDKNPPDLILLDVAMPGMDGFEVCQRLKKNPATENIPVIFVTADDTQENENTCWDCGAVDVVHKPINPRTLQHRVRVHLTLKFQSDLLRQMAFIDGLTGIANRRYLDQLLETEWRRCGRVKAPLSIGLLDIDHFKLYNDHYGHQQGDICLQQVAKIIVSQVKREADVVARYGGEEFCIVMPQTDRVIMVEIAMSVEKAVREANIPHEKSPTAKIVTVSIGVAAQIPAQKEKVNELVEQADLKLYQAKERGRARVVS